MFSKIPRRVYLIAIRVQLQSLVLLYQTITFFWKLLNPKYIPARTYQIALFFKMFSGKHAGKCKPKPPLKAHSSTMRANLHIIMKTN